MEPSLPKGPGSFHVSLGLETFRVWSKFRGQPKVWLLFWPIHSLGRERHVPVTYLVFQTAEVGLVLGTLGRQGSVGVLEEIERLLERLGGCGFWVHCFAPAARGRSICTQNGSHKTRVLQMQMEHPWRVLGCVFCGFHLFFPPGSFLFCSL